ncbi:conserved Plasmodium protein, unknown function [Plasmodium sp. gorilla clade G2]|uniref:conserved Plasmodium protein, unknown function n=1 Tax=Plasmodium sp. gorilla clade G2 TaxID=880535 RepID=UPI000D217280|nr:conserved Plasmodium protein, unknown function [Plasmodium sp. gorilla clade G2]SOV12653.1 conserved Plasmodium protein, unknown function [Plasmodium sp. gorilla clade G2]
MIPFYFFFFLLAFICIKKSDEKKISEQYEYINLLADKEYRNKLLALKKRTFNTKINNNNNSNNNNNNNNNSNNNDLFNKKKFVFSFYGACGYNKRKVLEKIFNITSEKDQLVNLGYNQRLGIWFGKDKDQNLNMILDIDLLENKEFIEKNNDTIYNYDKLIELILKTTNTVIIPLSNEDIQCVSDVSNKSNKIIDGKNKKSNNLKYKLPVKIELFLNELNHKIEKEDDEKKNKKNETHYSNSKDILGTKKNNVYLIFLNNEKENKSNYTYNNNFIEEIKLRYNNINFHFMNENKINLSLLQSNNSSECITLIDNIEHALKDMNTFKNFSEFNKTCVYNTYVIEESYIKTLNYFDKYFYIYEKNITMGKIINKYNILSNELINNSLLLFNLLTFEQSGTKFKQIIFEKLKSRFHMCIRRQILKQLLLLEKKYIEKGKDIILNKYYIKNDKELIDNPYNQLDILKTSLNSQIKQDIQTLIHKQFYNDPHFNNTINQFIYQFEDKLDHTLNNYYELNKSPFKKIFEKKKNFKQEENQQINHKKNKTSIFPSINMNLTLTSLIRKSGLGNLQSYFVYDLGLITFVFGLLNDRDTPEVQQQGAQVPFFKFQPKINLKLNFK